jgi:hypothetical protein
MPFSVPPAQTPASACGTFQAAPAFSSHRNKPEENPMISADQIREHMEVRGLDGAHIGTVDHMDGQSRIKLTRTDSMDGQHHYIPLDWVDHIDEHVHLSKNSDDVKRDWSVN